MGALAGKMMHPTQVPGIFRIPGRLVLSPDSLGPWGYLVVRGDTAVLVDVPYHSNELEAAIRQHAPGGVSHLLLTHDDFVNMSNHTEWRRSFPDLVRVAHSGDTRDPVEMELQGNGPWEVGDFRADHVPGHSRGSVFYSNSELSVVFTGDSLGFWSKPTAFPAFCRFGRARLAASLRGFAASHFHKHLLPGHGQAMYFTKKGPWQEAFEQAAKELE
mmetsp:Transcript_5778/g.8126  ORF Transcript_5778/g.8126 Transcript_5778/m.8126 type:complete len:216 (-) Transcript_5778:175-822(-)|eukprot:symbB.v1.2.024208.t1/scaffold2270.1/size83764/2